MWNFGCSAGDRQFPSAGDAGDICEVFEVSKANDCARCNFEGGAGHEAGWEANCARLYNDSGDAGRTGAISSQHNTIISISSIAGGWLKDEGQRFGIGHTIRLERQGS